MVDVTTGWDPKGTCEDETPSMLLLESLVHTNYSFEKKFIEN